MPVKNVEEAYEKIVDISNNNDYTTGSFLDFAYFNMFFIIEKPEETTFNFSQSSVTII